MSKPHNYRDTLQLPITDFPMRAALVSQEPKRLAKWQNQNIYQQCRQARQDAPKFVLNDGPPYANGPIHLGHCVNKILKDFIVKSHILAGFDAPFVPVWDCHGLPIEIQIEKKHGRGFRLQQPIAFRQACRDYAASQIELQRQDFMRLGILADWQHCHSTQQPEYEAGILQVVANLWQQGLLRQGYKPTPWCLDCRSTLSQAEIEYEEKTSASIEVLFVLADSAKAMQQTGWSLQANAALLIWTTTPWTLPANQAVAIDSELEYILLQSANGQQLVIGADCVAHLLLHWPEACSQVGDKIIGQRLLGLQLHHPFYPKTVSVLAGEHIVADIGTGCVHIAPDFGEEDFHLGQKNQLGVLNQLDDRGYFRPEVALVGGQHLQSAQQKILAILVEQGKLWTHQDYQHAYPFCWRHHTPLIYRATEQWFLPMQSGFAAQAAESLKDVVFTPTSMAKKLHHSVATRPDWCISRSRTWGVPLAFLRHRQNGTVHPRQHEWYQWLIEYTKQNGIDAIDAELAATWLGEEAADYQFEPHTLDVWFESGCSHAILLKDNSELAWPADLYLEGSDQHRGWFNSSLLLAYALFQQPPYRQVLTHGFTVDKDGRKMSKSLGNVIGPQQIVNQYGADVLRWWVASCDYQHEMLVSDQVFVQASEQYRRVRNTIRFLLANLHDFNPTEDVVPIEQWLAIDHWLLQQIHQLQIMIIKAYEEYRFNDISQALYNFCAETLGKVYLDIVKDRQYTLPEKSSARRAGQTTMWWALQFLVHAIAPILSFTADEICEYAGPLLNIENIFAAKWPELPAMEHINLEYWPLLWQWRDKVNLALEQARQKKQIGAPLEAELVLNRQACPGNLVFQLQNEWKYLFLVSNVIWQDSEQPQWVLEVKPAPGKKCQRCWHYDETVGSIEEYPEICKRCCHHLHLQVDERDFV